MPPRSITARKPAVVARYAPRARLAAAAMLFAAAAHGVPAEAAEDRIEPDRRDFTTGTGIVPAGRMQIEAGSTFTRGDDERHGSIGEISLRIPLSRSFEIHLGLPSYLIDHAPDRASGFDDTTVEARLRFFESDAVEVAVQLMAMIPSGSRRVAERYAQPGGVIAATLKLSPTTELVLDAGGNRASQDGKHFSQAVAAASLRVDAGERWNLFAEAYGFNREEPGGGSRQYAAAGAVYFIDKDTAVDARIGRGLGNGSGLDTLASIGLSYRF